MLECRLTRNARIDRECGIACRAATSLLPRPAASSPAVALYTALCEGHVTFSCLSGGAPFAARGGQAALARLRALQSALSAFPLARSLNAQQA